MEVSMYAREEDEPRVHVLVPKLRLGTCSAKLRFARPRNGVSPTLVPKRSLRTRTRMDKTSIAGPEIKRHTFLD